MPNSLSGNINMLVDIQQVIAAGDNVLNTYTIPIKPTFTISFTDGTGANQVNESYMGSGTLAVSTPVNIDLTSIVTLGGQTGFGHVRACRIYNHATVDGAVITLPAYASTFKPNAGGTGAVITIEAGAFFDLALKPLGTTGYAITNGVNDVIRLDPGTYAIAYSMFVLGN